MQRERLKALKNCSFNIETQKALEDKLSPCLDRGHKQHRYASAHLVSGYHHKAGQERRKSPAINR